LANHTVLIDRDGKDRPIDDSAAPIRDSAGATLGAVLVFRDVAERKLADQSRILLAAIVEASEDAIVSKTLDGVIRSWNGGAERLFGYTAGEAVGQPITLIIPPERRDEERAILERLRRGERVEHFETVRVARDGRRIDISLTVAPLFDEDGQVIGASKIARDITQRKQVEAALRAADRRKDEFLALLAHELRNPLGPLGNGVQLLRLAGNDADTVARVGAMLDRQLGHMVRLIDDLLDIARIGQNKIELRRARVPLASVIDSAVETARPSIEAGGHELSVSLPTEPLYLHADLTRLAQVFSNLLTNSAKYTRSSGHIWLTANRQGEDAVVSVRDDGIGIPADALPRVFDIFSQVDQSIERATGGLGIGLALVKGLVEMHGGRVSAESDGSGKGSTFTAQLPALDSLPEPADSAAAKNLPMSAGNGRRILVVDDNRDGALTLARKLSLLGNEVRTANDGIQAVGKAEEFHPEVILMDVEMPGLSGYDATRRIREHF
jgi:PAS domain S-box-containing protein